MTSLKKTVLLLPSFLFLIISCNNNEQHLSTNPSNPAQQETLGGDSDEHGCKGSAGYQWSALRNECIRIFEAGVGLSPMSDKVDTTLAVFAVFSTDADRKKVELFMPTEKPVIMDKTEGKNNWQNERFILSEPVPRQLVLEDKSNKVMYKLK